uniref:Glycoprotein p2 n=2 Tax=Hymenolepis diminuta TaxID=6216 RepID=A0A0R3SV52_HYMDI
LVLQGQTKIINEGSYEETYMFQTPCNFTILLNENRSRILPYSCINKTQINKLQTELLCPPEYHITLKQIIQYIYKANAPVGNTQTQNFIPINQQPVKYQPHFFTFFAAVMEVGEMKSAVVKRIPQKFAIPELMNPGLNTSADDGKNSQRLLHKCEITLIDETCGHFPMILWNEDLIMYALRFWKSKLTFYNTTGYILWLIFHVIAKITLVGYYP